jgi:hypothetical protein
MYLILAAMVFPILLFSAPVETDYALFLFDNGDKNLIASMLKYGEDHRKEALDALDFRIVFMGASIDAMAKEPFSHYPEKLIHYKQLGISETIDHQWKRDGHLSEDSLKALSENFKVKKKLWTGVSCSVFTQIVEHYQKNTRLEVVALRDNPSLYGDTDYFTIAHEVQNAAHKIAVPSEQIAKELETSNKKIVVIGQPCIEEWRDEANLLDKTAILKRLGLNPQIPIILYAGVYGDFYPKCFELFLALVPDKNVQVLIAPHPKFKGVVEIPLCEKTVRKAPYFKVVGEFIDDPLRKIKTVEALFAADLVVTADATSTIVFQANALKKKVLYVNPSPSAVSKAFCERQLIYQITSLDDFIKTIETKDRPSSVGRDVFALLGIPEQGAKLLFEEFLAPIQK